MAELVYALVLGTSTERFKSSSLFLPTKNMKITIDSKKGLKTNLKVFVDKKTIGERIRDLAYGNNLIFLFLEDTASIGIIKDNVIN